MALIRCLSTTTWFNKLSNRNHSQTTALGCRAVMSGRHYPTHDPAPLSLYNRSTTASRCISVHPTRGQNKPRRRRSDGVPCLRKGGGGG